MIPIPSQNQPNHPHNPSNCHQLLTNSLSRGSISEALSHYRHFRRQGLPGVIFLTPLILKLCARQSLPNLGKSFHGESIKSGVEFDIPIATSLLNFYAKCGHLLAARKVFDEMPDKNVVTWNAMIGGYLISNDLASAFTLFRAVPERTAVTWNEMIGGLAKCGDLAMARDLFDQVPDQLRNVVTWTVMVDGYARNGDMEAAMEVFEEMPVKGSHVWSCLVSGYCRKGEFGLARMVFDRIPVRNVVHWNALLSGFAQNGVCEEVIRAFGDMRVEGLEPDEVTVLSVLSACGQLGLLEVGKEVHGMVHEKGLVMNRFVANGLIDMYAKCGDLFSAVSVFETVDDPNEACWNSMILGFAIHGEFVRAVECFGEMVRSGGRPDDISFLSVLSACAHGGLVDEGLSIFGRMGEFGVRPCVRHYGCLIDLLARSGKVMDAFELAKNMPMKPNESVWGSILGACRIHSGSGVEEKVLEYLKNENSDVHLHSVLIANIYAASNRWEAAGELRSMIETNCLEKISGCSSLIS